MMKNLNIDIIDNQGYHLAKKVNNKFTLLEGKYESIFVARTTNKNIFGRYTWFVIGRKDYTFCSGNEILAISFRRGDIINTFAKLRSKYE